MAKQSVLLKESKVTTLNATGIMQLENGIELETEDLGVLQLEILLKSFAGKLVKISIKEQQEEELDFV